MATTTNTRKRARYVSKESDSEYEESSHDEESEEEYKPSPPKRKRPRRSPRRRNIKKAVIEQKEEDEDDNDGDNDIDIVDDEESDTENTNNGNHKIPSFVKIKMQKLEKENAALKKKVAALEKQVKSLKVSTKNATSSKKVNGKKYFTNFGKALVRVAKLKKTRFYGYSSEIPVEQTLDFDDFKQLFNGKGDKIQPTPHNKPKSVKTIIMFEDWEETKRLFNDYGVELNREIQVSFWRQGNIFRGKSMFLGKGTANVDSLTVEYNKSSRQLKLIFSASRKIDDFESMIGMPFVFTL